MEGFHTYFVSDLGILVHNAPCDPNIWTGKDPQKNLLKHWNNHGGDFPSLQNANEYQQAAANFLSNPPEGALIKNYSTGEIGIYDPISDVIAFSGRDGITPASFYRPQPFEPGQRVLGDIPKGYHGWPTNLDYFNNLPD